MISIKTEEELDILRQAGRILARIIKRLQEAIKPGIATQDINQLAEELIYAEKVLPAFKGYKGFPAAACTSVNEEIVHGIPGERKLMPGDIISLDLGINYQGYFADAAFTMPLGHVDSRLRSLIEVTRRALHKGIQKAQAENHLFDISYSIQEYVERNGFSVVRQFVGHGIGHSLHEDPEVPNFGRPHQGPVLKKGMVLAIEPMVNMGGWESEILDNGWTAVTKDRLASAHFEHTVAITEHGPEVLTKNG